MSFVRINESTNLGYIDLSTTTDFSSKFERVSLVLLEEDFLNLKQFLGKYGTFLPIDFKVNSLYALSVSIYSKPIVLRGTSSFNFVEYSGFYSLDGATFIDLDKSRYRYVFYVFLGFNNQMLLDGMYNSREENNGFNIANFSNMCGLNIKDNIYLDPSSSPLKVKFKPGSDGPIPTVSVNVADLVYENVYMLYLTPDHYSDIFGGTLIRSVTSDNSDTEFYYLVDIDQSTISCFDAMKKIPEWRINTNLRNYYSNNMDVFDDTIITTEQSIHFELPWLACGILDGTKSLFVDINIPVLFNKNSANKLYCPNVPYVSSAIIRKGSPFSAVSQTFSIIFPCVEEY